MEGEIEGRKLGCGGGGGGGGGKLWGGGSLGGMEGGNCSVSASTMTPMLRHDCHGVGTEEEQSTLFFVG
jgi:hypothetical protein